MAQIPYIFNQLTCHLPKDVFDRLVKKYGGNAYIKSYTCWNHLLVMIWAQLTSRRSLRDIEASLRAHAEKLYRLGIGSSPSRNNIAHSNSHRDVAIFRDMAQDMMCRASRISAKDKILANILEVFSLGGFFAVDSSTISLPLSRYPWSIPQEGSGGIKLHTMYDLMRNVPRMCLITGHEERDQTFMEDYPYESGCVYMLDRMYLKTPGLFRIHTCGAYFVTRMKRKILFSVVSDAPVDGSHVLADRTIRFTGRWASKGYPEELRLVSFYSTERNEVLEFLTNIFCIDAATVALLYRYRWQIELFFKWIKQHLRIDYFYGTSANAVMIQIYTALTTYCMLAITAENVGFEGSLYEFSNIMSVSLTEKAWISDLISRGRGLKAPEEMTEQPSLFDFGI